MTEANTPAREPRKESFNRILRRRISRRGVLKTGLALGTLVIGGSLTAEAAEAQAATGPGIAFQPVGDIPDTSQVIRVAAGHTAEVLLRWGDPLFSNAPAFDPAKQSRAAQEMQFGYNCDFVGFVPLPLGSNSSDRGLLWVNHEYTNPELMFPAYDPAKTTREWVDVELAAHGGTIVEVERVGGKMRVVQGSPYNRRITGFTPHRLSGPALGHDWLRTIEDPSGQTVLGTLNNCAGGYTPWGTILTCEENFNQYFGNAGKIAAGDQRVAAHARYGMPTGASERRWEAFHPRFDMAKDPNEPFRFGWVVEIDPYNQGSTPLKRTALGRFKHEGATFATSPSGRVAFYSGDDERFECVYKFVTTNAWSATNRVANQNLLDEGTLYVARFKDDGTGEWIPLVYGTNGLTAANGFISQADVLIKTRQAAARAGGTAMDRPEDIQQNPVNKKIYMAMTNNNQRGGENRPAPNRSNPRRDNRWGHIIEVTEKDNDVAATTFTWDIFLLCGLPSDSHTYFAGYPKDKVSPIAAPDNVTFDNQGNLWISTDGQPSAIRLADSVKVVPTAGPQRGNVQAFMTVVTAAEAASLEFTPDNRNFFLSVQHPAEGSTLANPSSRWPDGGSMPPRPAVVQVWNNSGGLVGQTLGAATAAPAPQSTVQPTALPRSGGASLAALAVAGAAAVVGGALLNGRDKTVEKVETETPEA